MFTDEFLSATGSYMKSQAEKLLTRQNEIASSSYNVVTGNLVRALGTNPVTAVNSDKISVEVTYPIYIRFLDMKKTSSGGATRRKKKKYAPIYNKFVYGYLKSDIWKKLNRLIPEAMVKAFDTTFTKVK